MKDFGLTDSDIENYRQYLLEYNFSIAYEYYSSMKNVSNNRMSYASNLSQQSGYILDNLKSVAPHRADLIAGPAPLTVHFTDLSITTPTGWNWTFGDNSLENATEQNPTHTYTESGNYTVTLRTSNGNGSNTTTRMNYIKVFSLIPIANFIASPLNGTVLLLLYLMIHR